MLEVLDVSKCYHAMPAVRRVSLTAAPGQVIGAARAERVREDDHRAHAGRAALSLARHGALARD